MAARFDAARARDLGQQSGDGTPIMLTIPTDEPWVPIRILALGLDKSQTVDADVFMLTDEKPKLLAGGRGLRLERSEQASASLLSDLRSDKGMEWTPDQMWLTYLRVQAAAGDLGYDLAVSTRPERIAVVDRRGHHRTRGAAPSRPRRRLRRSGPSSRESPSRSLPTWRSDRCRGCARVGARRDRAGAASAGHVARRRGHVRRLPPRGTRARRPTRSVRARSPSRSTIHHSRFNPDELVVREGTLVRFVHPQRRPDPPRVRARTVRGARSPRGRHRGPASARARRGVARPGRDGRDHLRVRRTRATSSTSATCRATPSTACAARSTSRQRDRRLEIKVVITCSLRYLPEQRGVRNGTAGCTDHGSLAGARPGDRRGPRRSGLEARDRRPSPRSPRCRRRGVVRLSRGDRDRRRRRRPRPPRRARRRGEPPGAPRSAREQREHARMEPAAGARHHRPRSAPPGLRGQRLRSARSHAAALATARRQRWGRS